MACRSNTYNKTSVGSITVARGISRNCAGNMKAHFGLSTVVSLLAVAMLDATSSD